jgi:HEAT repeat protein
MGAKQPFAWYMILRVIEVALDARAALREPGADPLAPELEQRLQALLADRAAPVLLRGLQAWQPGARRPDRRPRTAHLAAPPVPALCSCKGGFELAAFGSARALAARRTLLQSPNPTPTTGHRTCLECRRVRGRRPLSQWYPL